jgi:cytochrome c oxidase cbb3-type subunit 2
MSHEIVEKKIALMGALIAIVISVGGLVEIVPLYFQSSVIKASPGVTRYSALAVEGRDIYVREGCYNCHSQMVRTLKGDTDRYGHYSLAGESVYDHPFQFGSKRTGPDLARVGARYSDEWHRIHLNNPRDVVPESNMPGFPWLATNKLDGANTATKLRTLRILGAPYSDAEIAAAESDVKGKTEQEALINYLQGLKYHGSGQ